MGSKLAQGVGALKRKGVGTAFRSMFGSAWNDQVDENCQTISILFSKFSILFLAFISMYWPKTDVSLRTMRMRSYK